MTDAPRHTVAPVRGHPTGWDEVHPEARDAVLFVHGFPHRAAFWRGQLERLPPAWRGIAPDLRGFGDTPLGDGASMDTYADDCVALLDHLGVARAVVCGLSMGGYVAFALWRRHPARVRALVLADTRAGADGEEARGKRRETIALARRAGSAAVADAQLPGGVGRTTRERRPEVVEPLRALLASAPVDGIVAATEAMLARPDSTPTLATIDVPTLVIVGTEDVLTPAREAHALHRAIPHSRLARIDEAGHVSSVERPEAFAAELHAFLETIAEPAR
jgi:pimeloyl-ACP methyl ester carboxylesterase